MEVMLETRCIEIGLYMLENRCTIRQAAEKFGISKTTVHKDVRKRLKKQNKNLYQEVQELLDKNKSECHIRGGEATKKKYRAIREQK